MRKGFQVICNKIESLLEEFVVEHTAKWMEAEQKLDERTRFAYDSAAMGFMCD